MIEAFTKRKVVVCTEFHDHTCGYFSGNDLDILVDIHKQLARRFKDNPYVWFEPQNEPGSASGSDKDSWLTVHQTIIKAVRSEGNNNIVVVSGDKCGQGTNPIRNWADDVVMIDGKKDEHIVFTYHVWDQWQGKGISVYKAFHDEVRSKGYAVFCGEFAVDNNGANTYDASRTMMRACQEQKIGRVVWSWYGGDRGNQLVVRNPAGCLIPPLGCRGWLIDDCETPTNLTDLGKLVWNDCQHKEELKTLPGAVAVEPSTRLRNAPGHTLLTHTDGTIAVYDIRGVRMPGIAGPDKRNPPCSGLVNGIYITTSSRHERENSKISRFINYK
jgi:mannan endo-1,4-beta-mannosidase